MRKPSADHATGKSAIKALLSPAFAKVKGAQKVTSEAEAQTLLQAVNAYAFFLRVQRGGPTGSSSSSPKALQIIPEQMFGPEEYYAWFYEGSQWTTYAGGILMVAIMLAGVMFPLWPPIMRLGVWYLSMGMLGLIGLFFGLAIVRLIFYIITIVVASPGIWIFPQLFADVGFVRHLSSSLATLCLPHYLRSSHLFLSGNGTSPKQRPRRKRATRKRRSRPLKSTRTMGVPISRK